MLFPGHENAITHVVIPRASLRPRPLQYAEMPPALAAAAHVRSSHGQPRARAHRRIPRCPAVAAAAHVRSSHRQPCARTHSSMSRRLAQPALEHVRSSQGKNFDRAQLSVGISFPGEPICPRPLKDILVPSECSQSKHVRHIPRVAASPYPFENVYCARVQLPLHQHPGTRGSRAPLPTPTRPAARFQRRTRTRSGSRSTLGPPPTEALPSRWPQKGRKLDRARVPIGTVRPSPLQHLQVGALRRQPSRACSSCLNRSHLFARAPLMKAEVSTRSSAGTSCGVPRTVL